MVARFVWGKRPSPDPSERPGRELANGRIRARERSMHPGYMNRRPRTLLAVVGRSNDRRPRESANKAARNAAYRRLAVTMLGLDVATLADELRSARLKADGTEQLAA